MKRRIFRNNKKSFKKLVVAGAIVAIALCSTLGSSSRAYADFKPGCYTFPDGTQGTAPCDKSFKDQNGVPLDPAKYCYMVTEHPTTNDYSHVMCSDLTTPAGSSGSTDGIQQPQDPCNPAGGGAAVSSSCAATDLISQWINPVLSFLSIGVGLLITIIIVVAGIQYSVSRGDPQATAAAKKRIMNAVIAGVAYFLIYAFLKFLIPGGGGL